MAINKRYYWLKLQEDFFGQKEIKSLRKIAGGDTYTIIYLKMLLRSLSGNGVLYYDGIEKDFVTELALDIDEEEENVAITVQYLKAKNILVELNEDEFLLTTCEEMVGSETASTRRSRLCRKNKNLLQCNTNATNSNGEKEIEIEKDTEEDTEEDNTNLLIEQSIPEAKRVSYQQIADMYNDTCVSFPRLITLSDKRKKAIKARLKTYSVDDFKRLFEKAEASNFLKGANERNWSAGFDWLIKDSNMAKVLVGNYDNKKAAPRQKHNISQRQHDMDALERMLLNAEEKPKTVADDEALRERAEALRQQLA